MLLTRPETGPCDRLSTGQLLELLEGFGIEQHVARVHARETRLLADRAMPMMVSVLVALLGARRAYADAGLQQAMDDEIVAEGGS